MATLEALPFVQQQAHHRRLLAVYLDLGEAVPPDLLVHHANAQLRQLVRRYRLKRGGSMLGLLVLGGWLVFNHLPDQWTFAGMGLVALCGALGAWLTVRENRITIQPPES